MRLGFIGTGNMGSLLIGAFIASGAVRAPDVAASNRTRSKVERLAERFPGLRVANSNAEAAEWADVLFLCVKPLEFRRVIEDVRGAIRADQIVISITSPVLIHHLEQLIPGKIAKVIPSITHLTGCGPALCVFGERMTVADRQLVVSLLEHIGTPVEIDEAHTRVASDICSCGPAFLSFFVQSLIDAAEQEIGLPRELAVRLAGEMVLGTGKLLTSGGMTTEQLQEQVAVPGGITAEGLRLLTVELDGAFIRLLRTTHRKYDEDVKKVEAALFGTKVD